MSGLSCLEVLRLVHYRNKTARQPFTTVLWSVDAQIADLVASGDVVGTQRLVHTAYVITEAGCRKINACWDDVAAVAAESEGR